VKIHGPAKPIKIEYKNSVSASKEKIAFPLQRLRACCSSGEKMNNLLDCENYKTRIDNV
jgi:hypothetical protein